MDLRKASFEICKKEFKPFIEMAVDWTLKKKFQPIEVRVMRGNPATLFDYARRCLIDARKNGIGKFTAADVKRCKPPIRVHYGAAPGQGPKGSVVFSAVKRKQTNTTYWDNYELPFEILPLEDGRWVTLAVSPSREEVWTLADMMVRGVIESPIELRTQFTVEEVEGMLDMNAASVHVFKNGRCVMLWPQRAGKKKK